MMTLTSMLALAGAMFVIAIIPGPGVFAIVARSLSSGFGSGFWAAIGLLCGDFTFILLSFFGLAALAESMGELFIFVKYAGAIYLIWLGIQLWRTKPQSIQPIEGIETKALEKSWLSSFFAGLFITLGNPKPMVFYIGFFPAFLDITNTSIRDIEIVLIIATCTIGLITVGYAYMASRVGALFYSTKVRRKMDLTAGSVLIGVGAVLAISA